MLLPQGLCTRHSVLPDPLLAARRVPGSVLHSQSCSARPHDPPLGATPHAVLLLGLFFSMTFTTAGHSVYCTDGVFTVCLPPVKISSSCALSCSPLPEQCLVPSRQLAHVCACVCARARDCILLYAMLRILSSDLWCRSTSDYPPIGASEFP